MVIVLLHGAGCDHRAMRPLADALRARGLEVMTPDLPGRGDVAGPACSTAREAADAVGRELDSRGVLRPIVLGHSYGGSVAIELAMGRALGGLVLAATGARLRVHPSILDTMRVAETAGRESPPTFGWTEGAASPASRG
jgi:pimeloyl-ACP methyl ester carboxylesterase